jgi:hypothetical protein
VAQDGLNPPLIWSYAAVTNDVPQKRGFCSTEMALSGIYGETCRG